MAEDDNQGTLETLVLGLGRVLEPLYIGLQEENLPGFLAELGFYISEGDATTLASDTAAVATSLESMIDNVVLLVEAIDEENYEDMVSIALTLIDEISDIITAFEDIREAIDDLELTDVSPDQISDIPANLFDYLLVENLSSIQFLPETLEFLGVLEREDFNADVIDPDKPPYTISTFNWDKLMEWFDDPSALMSELYDWGESDFDGTALLTKLEAFIAATGLPVLLDEDVSPPVLDAVFVDIYANTDVSPPGLQIDLKSDLNIGELEIDQGGLTVTLNINLDAPDGGGILIHPSGQVEFIPTTVDPSFSGSIVVRYESTDGPQTWIGQPGASRLEVGQWIVEAGASLEWDGVDRATGEFYVEGEINEGKVIVAPADPDGFLAKILPEDGFELEFDSLFGVSSSKGVYFRNSGTLSLDIPVNLSLGPIEVQNLNISVSPGSVSTLGLGADIKTVLGPFTAIVEGIGIDTDLTITSDNSGNLGLADLAIDFKPPTGIGLTLDAGTVTGGGYLSFDHDNGKYSGAIELSFEGLFSFSAVGIITTQFPDGSEGYSLLLLINVEFGTPFPLGYNFYLAGLGGMIGLHRSMSTEKLREGVKDGSIDNIMFPEDVIENIHNIINDLDSFFPAVQDQFVIGLMARITWNTPAVLTIDFGLLIEFSNPVAFAIVGVIKLALPTPEDSILQINVAFIGIIDFDAGMLSFDASIYNSKILTITLEGDMALRLSWGQNKDFLLSVGGFHPSYTPPSYLDLPAMKRMTVNILSGNPSLVLTSYFAVTTNTIQFGADIDFTFKVEGFGVYGHFGFDVLFQFAPFKFLAGISASVSVKSGNTTLLSISIEFNLQGPRPWRAWGNGSFKVLLIKVKVKFDVTWGSEKENSLPGTEVMEVLLEEFEKSSNWTAELPDTKTALVTYFDFESDDDNVIVDPVGGFQVNQSVVPLDVEMTKFGNYSPTDISKANIKAIKIGPTGSLIDMDTSDLTNSFAPDAYRTMEDDDKLKAPSYEELNSGAKVSSTDATSFDYVLNRKVQYDVTISDEEEEELGFTDLEMDWFRPFVNGGAVGKSPLSKSIKQSGVLVDNAVKLSSESYSIVNTSDLTMYDSEMTFANKTLADEALKDMISADSSLAGSIQTTAGFQVNTVEA